MYYVIHYDIIAFIISIIIYCVAVTYKQLSINSAKYFRQLTLIVASASFFDIVCTVFSYYYPNKFLALHYIFHILHLLFQNSVPYMYLFFSYSFIYENNKFTTRQLLSGIIPLIICSLGIISTPFTNLAFYFDENFVYHRGLGQIYFYAIGLVMVFLICANVIKNKRILSKSQQLSILSYSILFILAAIIQVLNPSLLLLGVASSISLVLIFISIQNPLEFIDVKTKLGNRTLFKKVINSADKFNKRYFLICVQIEGIAYINEKFNTDSGNLVIEQIAQFFTSIKNANSVYRISNTQFAILLEEEDNQYLFINSIKDRFDKPFYLPNILVNVFVKCKICYINSLAEYKATKDIFNALAYAFSTINKSNSNNIVEVSSEILLAQKENEKISHAIDNAIKNKSFDVYYQPIYSIEDNKYTSMEALVRLNDNDLGFVPPDKFIPIAEKSGEILEIGEIVLEKVCNFASQFMPYKYGINSIHVNLSVVQCMQDDIYSKLMNIINKYPLPQGFIDFEITETTADNTNDCLDKIMNSFNKDGIKFSLDDFGTGYSNQSNIMRHPYSIVKIDKSMVWSCDTNPKASISLKHTIAMIRELEMKVLAEGVETEDQKQFLKEIGCDYLQGYYFARPLPEKDVLEHLQEKNAI